jgi:quinol monooxygenase YgiN
MILIAGTFHLKPEEAERALAAMLTVQEASETEAGCVHYRFMPSLTDKHVVHVFEEWESLDALGAHYGTAHVAAFNGVLGGFLASSASVEMYDGSAKRPLKDPR